MKYFLHLLSFSLYSPSLPLWVVQLYTHEERRRKSRRLRMAFLHIHQSIAELNSLVSNYTCTRNDNTQSSSKERKKAKTKSTRSRSILSHLSPDSFTACRDIFGRLNSSRNIFQTSGEESNMKQWNFFIVFAWDLYFLKCKLLFIVRDFFKDDSKDVIDSNCTFN